MRILFAFLLTNYFTAFSQTNPQPVLVTKTTGKMPMLAYGLGQDRLGGAKLGYVDTGITLKIVDSINGQYLVQLSKNHTAYITKEEVNAPAEGSLRPYYLTNSWLIKGDASFDYVSINMDEKLPYKSWMEVDPSKIMIDLFGVQSNTNWITQLHSATEIKSVFFSQTEDDVVRVTIELNHPQHWGYSIYYAGNNLMIRVRRQPESLRFKKLKIAIDAGHGGDNKGAAGLRSNTFEKDYTLRFAEELKIMLEKKGAKVIMTRNSDTSINNVDRYLMLQKEMPDLLVSLHLNSSDNPLIKGVSTYYKHIGYKPISTAILDRLLQLNLNEFGNVGNFNFALSAPTDFPNTLVEIAFISNAEDERRIIDPRFQMAVAQKICKGISDWLNKNKH